MLFSLLRNTSALYFIAFFFNFLSDGYDLMEKASSEFLGCCKHGFCQNIVTFANMVTYRLSHSLLQPFVVVVC